METMERKTLSCSECSYQTFRAANMTRHRKRHDDPTGVSKVATKTAASASDRPSTVNSVVTTVNTDVESWHDQDPGDLLGEVSGSSVDNDSSSEDECSSVQMGRTIRKPTRPIPVAAPKRKLPHPKDPINMVPVPIGSLPSVKKVCHVGIQTDLEQPASRRTVTKTTKYTEEGRDIEIVEYFEFFGDDAKRSC